MKIIGTGRYLPERVLSNEDLETIVDTSNEWIHRRTGIKKRHLIKNETTAEMAAQAALKAVRMANYDVKAIDLIIVATITADFLMPSTACEVQQKIGATNAVAYDISAACSGFVYGLVSAYSHIKAGFYQNALVIGAEAFSKLLDWNDRSTCVLFGDGAGAVLIEASNQPFFHILGSDGSNGKLLSCANRQVINPFVNNIQADYFVHMDGQEVFKFAITKVTEVVKDLLKYAQIDKEAVAYYVLHQANTRILDTIAKRLQLVEAKFPRNIEEYGNTSAASIPILLDELNQNGSLNRGDKLLLAGFGGGLTWGAALIEW